MDRVNIEISFGWLALTIPAIYLKEFYSLIDDTPVSREYGFNGYGCSAVVLGDGLVGWTSGRPDAHICLKAQALSLINGGHVDSILDIVKWAFSKRTDSVIGHLTRLDISYDDKTGIVSVPNVERALSYGDVVTRSRKWRPDGDYEIGKPAVDGGTVYIGSRKSSDAYLCVYDKAKEQGLENTHWTRFEYRSKNKIATLWAELLIKAKGDEDMFKDLALGMLAGFVEFKDKNSDSNPSRRTRLGWWQKFVGDVSKVKVNRTKTERTIGKTVDWFEKQVTPSLALIKEVYGSRFQVLLDGSLKSAKRRWKAPHLAMLKGKENFYQGQGQNSS